MYHNLLTSVKQMVDAVINRDKHKANYDKAQNDEIAKHQKSLLRSNKRIPKKTNHFVNGQPRKKRRASKPSSAAKVKVEPQVEDPDMEAEITAISAEFVDFVFVI